MGGQRPRQGWIYSINPYRVSLRCKLGHVHIYNLDEPGEVEVLLMLIALKTHQKIG